VNKRIGKKADAHEKRQTATQTYGRTMNVRTVASRQASDTALNTWPLMYSSQTYGNPCRPHTQRHNSIVVNHRSV